MRSTINATKRSGKAAGNWRTSDGKTYPVTITNVNGAK
jgi:hypothetical protein